MGGEGHMLDMIRRLEEGRTASRLRRERIKEKMRRTEAGEPFQLPDTTPEEMDRIIRQSKEKKESENRYFVFGTLIFMGILILGAVIGWFFFIR